MLSLAGPAAATEHELLAVKSTSYPIPEGAVFVSAFGSDQNAGTITRPLRTVSAAITAASEGGTIVIRQGTYREALPDLSKRLTLQPFPGETVWLKGSMVAAGWVADGNAWRMLGRAHDFCGDCFHPDNIDPAFPTAGLPDQVFIDAAPLKQVARRSLVTAGSFYVDRTAKRLFIGSDPRGRTVEVSVRGTALAIENGGQGSIVRGLGFAHYSPVAQPGLGGTVKGNAGNLTFENNTFAWSAAKGLVIFATRGTVRGNTFIYNGMMGLGAWNADGLKVTGNRFAFNNQEGFVLSGTVSEAAGAKLTNTRDLQVTDNVFEGNLANGLWLDINISNAVITRNVFKANRRHGVFYEISSNGIIASNIAERNAVAGIALANATHIQVYNNTLFGNAFAFLVQADDRVNNDPEQVKLGNSWIAGATYFYNNLISGTGELSRAFIWARDFSGVLNADQMISGSGFNGYHRVEASKPRHVVEWWQDSKRILFININEFQSKANRDIRSFMVDDTPINPFFSGARSGKFALAPGSVARNAGRDLPTDVALAIGVSNRRAPNLGALLLPGGAVVSP
ncbi:MAG: right-handed parallel beta-helix repeat-containing protein [Rhizobiales bacterium]|nr:right-handed parallel beta-helix repeat-containing protein [Hyphomicrobiales bacterium]